MTKWCFYLFLCSIPFETITIPFLGDGFSVAKFFGLVLCIFGLLDAKVCFRNPPLEFWLLLLYVVVGETVAFALGGLDNETLRLLTREPQLLVLFLISYNILRTKDVRKWAVLFLCMSIGTFSWMHVLQVFELRSIAENVEGVGLVERTSGLGTDPNFATALAGVGIICCVVALVSMKDIPFALKVSIGVLCAGCLLSVARMSSRGGILSIALGLFTFAWFTRKSRHRTFIFGGLVMLLLVGVYLLAGSDLFRSRIDRTISSGDTAGRFEIWSAALTTWSHNPVFGRGFGRYISDIGWQLGGEARNTHNLFLSALVSTGLTGLITVLIVMFGAWRSAINAIPGWEGILAAALLTLGVGAGMSLNLEHQKWFWIVLSFAIALRTTNTPRFRRTRRRMSGIQAAPIPTSGTSGVSAQGEKFQ